MNEKTPEQIAQEIIRACNMYENPVKIVVDLMSELSKQNTTVDGVDEVVNVDLEELVEEFVGCSEGGSVNVGMIRTKLSRLLEEKERAVEEEVKRELEWVKMILGYKHVDEVKRLITDKLQALSTPETKDKQDNV